MPIISRNFEAMSIAKSTKKSVSELGDYTIRINLEFLKGCEFTCPGCYVNRSNDFTVDDLSMVEDAVTSFQESGFNFDEIILGPTDFFSALNCDQVLKNAKFRSIFKSPDITLILISTLQTKEEEIIRRIKLLNDSINSECDIEFLIVFDLEKILSKDQDYIEEIKRKIKLLDNVKADVDYAFQINIRDINGLENFNLLELTGYVRDEFDTIVEFNPSFLRSSNEKNIHETLHKWNNLLAHNYSKIEAKDVKNVLFTMGNKNHASLSEVTYNYKNGTFYTCPFVYENIFNTGERFKINATGDNGRYKLSDFHDHRNRTTVEQLQYSEKTRECSSCNHLLSCVGKQVLQFMEEYKIKTCPLAKEVMDLY